MAVLSKFRSRWRTTRSEAIEEREHPNIVLVSSALNASYELRALTVAQLEDCWRLDQRCFLDGEAYSRETFEYLHGSEVGDRGGPTAGNRFLTGSSHKIT